LCENIMNTENVFPASQLIINLLGAPDIRLNEQTLPFPTRKTLALLIYLAVEGGAHSRDALATLLWPSSDPEQARAALRQTLAMLKKILYDPAKPEMLSYVLTTRADLSINPTTVITLDIQIVQAALDAVQCDQSSPNVPTTAAHGDQQATDAIIASLEAAIARYRGHFLAGFTIDDAPEFEHWVMVQGESWHQRMHHIFESLSLLYLTHGAPSAASAVAQRWVAHDPLHEPAYRCLIAAQLAAGDRSAALRAYRACRAALADELGIDPEPKTEELAQTILAPVLSTADRAGSVQTSTQHMTPAGSLQTIAQPATSLIGRSRELAAIRQLFDSGARLLTLVGPPGVGKTRLALAAAAALAPTFIAGVEFIDLTPIHDPEFVLAAITQTLGLREDRQRSPGETLKAHLWDKQYLLIFDNFEQVLPAAALVAELLTACPALAIIVTSRERLRLQWEYVVSVSPLVLPNLAGPLNAATILQAPAVQLFVERARANRSTFALTDGDAAATAQLCVRLDGLPLALELVAAHSAILPPAALLSRLEQRRPLPRHSIRDLPARHQTLQAAIEASYKLLSPTNQIVFRRLAVFSGGWTLDAAEEVIDAAGLGIMMLDTLAALVDHNLIQVVDGRESEPRFGMLVTIHEYAWAQLEVNSELAAIQARHAAYFVDLVEQAQRQFRGPQQGAWVRRLDQELDNLRATLTWTADEGTIEMGLRISTAMGCFWEVRGLLSEGRRWLERILSREGGEPAIRSRTLHSAGAIAHRQGDFDRAMAYYEAALAIHRTLADPMSLIKTIHNMALTTYARGELIQAAELFDESLTLSRSLGNTRLMASTLNNWGIVAIEQKEYEQGTKLLTEALLLYREQNDSQGIATALDNLGLIAIEQGRIEQARVYWHESLIRNHKLGYHHSIACNIEHAAILSAAKGKFTHVGALFGAVVRIRKTINVPWDFHDHRRYEPIIAATRSALGSDTFAAEWEDGYHLTTEQAVELALEALTPPKAQNLGSGATLHRFDVPVWDATAEDHVACAAVDAHMG
jgi:non-specific serine/threonine protein kinase